MYKDQDILELNDKNMKENENLDFGARLKELEEQMKLVKGLLGDKKIEAKTERSKIFYSMLLLL